MVYPHDCERVWERPKSMTAYSFSKLSSKIM
jgi:hypothetical protein